MSRHSTAASLPGSVAGGLAEDLDQESSCDFDGAAEWDLGGSFDDEEEFQDRPRFEYQIDEDMVFRPDLYADAFEVADGDFLLHDWESDELPEEDAAALAIEELETEASYEVQPDRDMMSFDASEDMVSVDVSETSTLEDGSPRFFPKVSMPEDASSRSVPKAPPSTAPRGFARKHQDVLVVGSSVRKASETSPPKHEHQDVLVVSPSVREASETSPPKHEVAKMPQGSAKAAIAALRPAVESSCSSGSAASAQPVVPTAPAEKPLKKRPCNSVAMRLAGGAATAPVTSTLR